MIVLIKSLVLCEMDIAAVGKTKKTASLFSNWRLHVRSLRRNVRVRSSLCNVLTIALILSFQVEISVLSR